jgi:signal peptidase I
MPAPVVVAIVASVVALAVLWVAPAAGLVLAGAVIVAGLVLLATGRPAVGAVVALMPFAVFLLASQVVGTLWFKPYRVPSESMEPTIEIGDRILADRHDRSPHVGDVVIAHPPVGAVESRCGTPRRDDAKAACARATPELSDVVFIKRVVAGPGDTIAFRDGLVVRNGRPVTEPYARSCTDAICELL